MNEAIQILYDSEKIQKALSFLKEDAENTVAQQIELASIPAYSNHEEKKAARIREIIEEMGYQTKQDEVGNVFAVIEGPKEAPVVMVTAHMDTVFPMDTDLTMHREGSRICMPGI
ncbi:MAG: peptidase M20, partial [Firmicutes bacterium]|nr:peptidase M20 [Bacillota bacterium]